MAFLFQPINEIRSYVSRTAASLENLLVLIIIFPVKMYVFSTTGSLMFFGFLKPSMSFMSRINLRIFLMKSDFFQLWKIRVKGILASQIDIFQFWYLPVRQPVGNV